MASSSTRTSRAKFNTTTPSFISSSFSLLIDLIGVKNALLNSARKTDSLAGKVFSGGMLDAGAAMAYGRGQ